MAQKTEIEYIRFYTDGSAARKVDTVRPVAPSLPTINPKRKKRYVLRVYPLETLAILTAIAMFVMILVGTFSCLNQAQEKRRLQGYVVQLEERHEYLEDKYTSGYDLEQIEKTAIAIGMVPAEQVEHVQIQIPVTHEEAPANLWDRMVTFLTSLFA